MQPHTLFIYITSSALFFAKKNEDDDFNIETTRSDINPNKPFAAVLDGIISTKREMIADAEHINIIIDSPVTLIPMSEFSEDTYRKYYDYCIPSDNERRVFFDSLPIVNAMVVFSVAENVYATLKERFENVHFCSGLTQTLSYFVKKNSPEDSPKKLLSSLRDGYVDIIAVEAGRLISVNTFEVSSTIDAVYYTYGTAAMLAFSHDCDDFYIAGEKTARDSFYEELCGLVKNVSIIDCKEFSAELMPVNAEEIPLNLLTHILV